MPVTKRNGKWYWGSKGPFESKKKAEEVGRAAHASDTKIEKIEYGVALEGDKPHLVERPLTTHPSYPPRDKTRRKRIEWHGADTPTIKMEKDGDKSSLPPEQLVKPKHPPAPSSQRRLGSQRQFIEPHSTLQKEGDGGESSSVSYGGTVFTSTNAGIFSPTHGERKVKSKKKRSGVEKLGVYLTDGSPTKKSAGLELVDWLLKYEEEENPQEPVEADSELPHDSAVLAEQQDMENKIKVLAGQDKKRRNSMESNANPPTGGEGSLPDNNMGQSRAFALSKQPMMWGPDDGGGSQDDELRRTGRLDVDEKDDEKYYNEEFEKAMGHLFTISKEDRSISEPTHPVVSDLLNLMRKNKVDNG